MSDKIDMKVNVNHGAAAIESTACEPTLKWFIAIVNSRAEKAVGEKLTKAGIENYVPLQTVYKVWRNGRKAKVEHVVISNVVFIRCSELKRKEIVKLPFIFRFMTNKAGSSRDSLSKPIAVVSDHEIKQLKFMLGQSDIPVNITQRPYKVGEKVRIIRGSLIGLEGEVFEINSETSELVVVLEHFGCAKLTIDTVNIEPLKDDPCTKSNLNK